MLTLELVDFIKLCVRYGLPVYCCVCDIVNVGLPDTLMVELEDADDGTDCVTVNDPEPVGV
jgi:hypothetical protein